jgi:hypothetical protein
VPNLFIDPVLTEYLWSMLLRVRVLEDDLVLILVPDRPVP